MLIGSALPRSAAEISTVKVLTYFSTPSTLTGVTTAETACFSLVLAVLDCSTSASLVYFLASGVVVNVTFALPVSLSISTFVLPFAGENMPRSVTMSVAFSVETTSVAVFVAVVVVFAAVSANAKEVVPIVAAKATVRANDKNFLFFISSFPLFPKKSCHLI